jgi:hypothetical protein
MGLGFHYHWLFVLVISIILFIVFVVGYASQPSNQQTDLPFWLWFVFFLALTLLILSFAMHTTEKVAAGPIPNTPDGGAWYHRDVGFDVAEVAQPYPTYIGSKGMVSRPSVMPIVSYPAPPCQPCIPCDPCSGL